ncbi:MAG TPA: DUF5706 domain-containing protein [Saprospiraceae bacterium]|nr:DUF5706 domain-containing protein [Saprospiraceae bacterium]
MEEKELKKVIKLTGRERQTLFRSVYRNQNNLIRVADSKANMIIGINTMIISSIIAIIGYGVVLNRLESYGKGMLFPVIFILLTCLTSTVLSIQAVRPRIIRESKRKAPPSKFSLLFFGEIAKYTQDQYVQSMENLLLSQRDIYQHMIVDLYHQGVVLDKKYKLIAYAYAVFLFGFVAGVFSFVIQII